MKTKKHLMLVLSLFLSPELFSANPSINELNSCLALVDFVDTTLDNFSDHYTVDDMAIVHGGLSAYKNHLKNDVITPKLLSMYGGNEMQAKLMQKLFDRQRATFFEHLSERYSEKKLFTEYAAAINDCTANTRIRPEVAKPLNTALDKMIIMARQIQ